MVTLPVIAFATPVHFLDTTLSHSAQRRAAPLSPRRAAPSAALTVPDAGLVSEKGITGTVCTNLWPLPILGSYGWFLNVWRSDVAADVGAFAMHSAANTKLTLRFAPGEKPRVNDGSVRAFNGIVTGNYNVAAAVRELGDAGEKASYEVLMFDKGNGKETFLQRNNEVRLVKGLEAERPGEEGFWNCHAPTFVVSERSSSYEVRQCYSSGGSPPRSFSKMEYFAMNLFPIAPFAKYSCFVCVWKQSKDTCPVAIDKVEGKVSLMPFDCLEIQASDAVSDLPTIGRFAAKFFFGAVTDAVASQQHKQLLNALRSSPSHVAKSSTNFRVVVDNKPGVVTPNRRNEIWVELR